MQNWDSIKQYPISSYLDEICSSLKNSKNKTLILTAETGAGKSTVLPVGLLEAFEGKIIMTEPRRLAAVGVAQRVSELLNEDCGNTAGYKIHLENKTSQKTRLEVVTEAVLIRQLQSDPALEGIQLVVLDEFHERSIYTDLALAFLQEAQELRDDLYVIVMSATMDCQKLQEYFNGAPVLSIPGRSFEVKITYDGGLSIKEAVLKAVNDSAGSILVFLPGISDIKKQQAELENSLPSDTELCILHSSISFEEQKHILTPPAAGTRRVILSSAIAETSLTVPDITYVIDSGLARVNRLNIATGMNNLVTETESEFSAAQRAGRAGRLMAGKCLRLWNEADGRVRNFPPEILRSDLTQLILECAERGAYEVSGLKWLDLPNINAWEGAKTLLRQISCLDQNGRITQKGRAVLKLSLPLRLASIALEAEDRQERNRLILKYGNYRNTDKTFTNRLINDIENRIVPLKNEKCPSGLLILAGYPDRIAKRITEIGIKPAEYQFCSGRKAILSDASTIKGEPMWICAPEVVAGDREGVIFEAEVLPDELIEGWLWEHSEKKIEISVRGDRPLKEELTCYGQITLSSKKLEVQEDDFKQFWLEEIKRKGIKEFCQNEKIDGFLLRCRLYAEVCKNGNQNFYEKLTGLEKNADEWLLPFMTSSKKPQPEQIYDALYWYLDGKNIDNEVPLLLVLENGRKVKVKYESQKNADGEIEIKPVVEIIIQRAFGCFRTPEICGKKVLLKLLSPASRPLQITEDLEHFWTGAWVEICREMKGRYPKHNWDYRIVEKDE